MNTSRTFSKTNFQQRQAKARKKSQQLFIVFVMMTFFTATCYGAIMFGLVVLFNMAYPWLCAIMTALLCAFVISDGYYIEHKRLLQRGAIGISERMGGKTVQNPTVFNEKKLINIVEEMAIASGLPCPNVLISRYDTSINAFVTCDVDGEKFAITVSQGALRYLNREELQVVIAHEFGHIKNGDVKANVHLSAVLHGFFMLSDAVAPNSSNDNFTNSKLFGRSGYHDDEYKRSPFGLIGVMVWIITSLMIFFGQLLQAAFSRTRERLADAHAVEYTRNSPALVSVFTKILALQDEGVFTRKIRRNFAHFYFHNPYHRWATHPLLTERIKTYGDLPSASDLETVRYRLHNLAQEQVTIKKAYDDETGLSLMPDTNANVSMLKQAFEQFLPIKVLQQYQKALDASPSLNAEVAINHIIAHFVHYANVPLIKLTECFHWDKSRYDHILTIMDELTNRHDSVHLSLFLRALRAVNAIQNVEKKALLDTVNTIIKADKIMTWHEMCMLLCLRTALGEKNREDVNVLDYHDSIAFLLQVMANISSEHDAKKHANYRLLVEKIMPSIKDDFKLVSLDNTCVQKLFSTVQTLRHIRPAFVQDLLVKVEANMYFDNKASTQQLDIVTTLKYVLS